MRVGGFYWPPSLINTTSLVITPLDIPFDFSAGKAMLKAGVYSIKRTSGNLFAIRSADGKTTALVNAPLIIGPWYSKASERLVFNQYGDQYFLSQVWLSVDTGRQVFTSGAEIKAAREYKLANNNAKLAGGDRNARDISKLKKQIGLTRKGQTGVSAFCAHGPR
jgi:hypothetical protein